MVNSNVCPPRTAGTMEAIMANLMIAAVNVQASRTLGFRLEASTGMTSRETRTAISGFIDIIVIIGFPEETAEPRVQ